MREKLFGPAVVLVVVTAAAMWGLRLTIYPGSLAPNVLMTLMALGALSNYTAVRLNGGKMPVAVDWRVSSDKHQNLTPTTKVRWLCDILTVSRFTFSIGDVLVIGAWLSSCVGMAISLIGDK